MKTNIYINILLKIHIYNLINNFMFCLSVNDISMVSITNHADNTTQECWLWFAVPNNIIVKDADGSIKDDFLPNLDIYGQFYYV